MRVYSIALPVVGSFSLLWRTSSFSSWKNTQVHLVGDLHLNGTRNPTLYFVLQKIWIPFMKIKPSFGWLLFNPYQKINGLPVFSNGSNQLFKEKDVIQIQLWFLKIKKLGSESNYNHGIWTSLLESELELLISNRQSRWPTNTALTWHRNLHESSWWRTPNFS